MNTVRDSAKTGKNVVQRLDLHKRERGRWCGCFKWNSVEIHQVESEKPCRQPTNRQSMNVSRDRHKAVSRDHISWLFHHLKEMTWSDYFLPIPSTSCSLIRTLPSAPSLVQTTDKWCCYSIALHLSACHFPRCRSRRCNLHINWMIVVRFKLMAHPIGRVWRDRALRLCCFPLVDDGLDEMFLPFSCSVRSIRLYWF